MRTATRAAACCLLSTACGQTHADDAADASAVDAARAQPDGASSDGIIHIDARGSCSPDAALDCELSSDAALAPILLASDFGAARFIDVARDLVLGERDNGGAPEVFAVRIHPSTPTPVETVFEPAVALSGQAKYIASAALGDPGVILSCTETSCSLVAVRDSLDAGSGDLTPIPASELSGVSPAEIHGLIRGDSGSSRVCTFGAGVHCFEDAAWTTIVVPTGANFWAAALRGEELWLAGDQGRLLRLTWPGPQMLELWTGQPARLGAISESPYEKLLYAADDDGTVFRIDGEILTPICTPPPASVESGTVVGIAPRWWEQGEIAIARSSGELTWSTGSFSCRNVTPAPLLEGSASLCGVAPNFWLLSEQALIGERACAVD